MHGNKGIVCLWWTFHVPSSEEVLTRGMVEARDCGTVSTTEMEALCHNACCSGKITVSSSPWGPGMHQVAPGILYLLVCHLIEVHRLRSYISVDIHHVCDERKELDGHSWRRSLCAPSGHDLERWMGCVDGWLDAMDDWRHPLTWRFVSGARARE